MPTLRPVDVKHLRETVADKLARLPEPMRRRVISDYKIERAARKVWQEKIGAVGG
jgi:hypothetical protein